jgi:hypothetical protein
MPASEAQKRAMSNYRMKNKQKIAEIFMERYYKKDYEKRRDKIIQAISNRYYVKKEFKAFLGILLE